MAEHTVIYLKSLEEQDGVALARWVSADFDKSQFFPEIADLILSAA